MVNIVEHDCVKDSRDLELIRERIAELSQILESHQRMVRSIELILEEPNFAHLHGFGLNYESMLKRSMIIHTSSYFERVLIHFLKKEINSYKTIDNNKGESVDTCGKLVQSIHERKLKGFKFTKQNVIELLILIFGKDLGLTKLRILEAKTFEAHFDGADAVLKYKDFWQFFGDYRNPVAHGYKFENVEKLNLRYCAPFLLKTVEAVDFLINVLCADCVDASGFDDFKAN